MGTRTLRWLGALVVAMAALAFLAIGTASAQDADGSGDGVAPPCPAGETCVEPQPEPCPPEICGDADGDGFMNAEELYLGSDPNNAASTPEFAYFPETCTDGADNDGDGAIDGADSGCTVDSDGDGVQDVSDNCPWDPNADQADADADGEGDVCDFDADNDGWDDRSEELFGSDPANGASTPEHSQLEGTCGDGADNDADGATDADDAGCAPDGDFDFVPDASDNCPTVWNQEQTDSDGDGLGDACEDSDGDGFFDGDELGAGSDPNNAASTPEFAGDSCTDGLDNDLDGAIDGADEGCQVFLEAADGTGRDTDEKTEDDMAPVSLPASGTGFANESSLPVWALALAGALALTGGGFALGARRLARERVRTR